MFISEASAQTAEAIQAAQGAVDILLQYKILGAFCVVSLLANGVFLWRLSVMHERYAALITQVVTIGEGSKAAIVASTSATERMQAAQAVAAEALREQGQETVKEIQENRHTVANHLAVMNAVMELLARQRQGAA